MSASKDKRTRARQRSEGTERRQVSRNKQHKERVKRNVRNIIVGALLFVLIAAAFLVNSSFFYTVTPAVTVGGRSYTAAEYNYYYYYSYNEFVSNYEDYLEMFGLDTSKPLNKQPYGENSTWADYFHDAAIDRLKSLSALLNAADEAGFTLSEESKTRVDDELDYWATIADMYDQYSNVDQLLSAQYGKHFNAKTFRRILERNYLSSDFYSYMQDSYQYTDEETEAYYAEHKDELDQIDYRSYYVSGAVDEDEGADAEAAMNDAKAIADTIAAAVDEEDFIRLAYEAAPEESKVSYEDDDATKSSQQGKEISSAFSEWLLDGSRKKLDISVVETDDGYYVVMFLSRNDNHYHLRNVRHLLIKAEQDEDGEYTDETKEAARQRCEELLAEWKNGEATEESFAAMANEFSDDGGSNTNGGLYEDIYQGQMVSGFEAFVFDPARRPGDTGIVYGESGNYAGYHIIYYVSESPTLFSNYLADYLMRNDAMAEWYNLRVEAVDVRTRLSMYFVQ